MSGLPGVFGALEKRGSVGTQPRRLADVSCGEVLLGQRVGDASECLKVVCAVLNARVIGREESHRRPRRNSGAMGEFLVRICRGRIESIFIAPGLVGKMDGAMNCARPFSVFFGNAPRSVGAMAAQLAQYLIALPSQRDTHDASRDAFPAGGEAYVGAHRLLQWRSQREFLLG